MDRIAGAVLLAFAAAGLTATLVRSARRDGPAVVQCWRCGDTVAVSRQGGPLTLDILGLESGSFDAELVDADGAPIASGRANALAEHQATYECPNLRRGIYYLRLRANGVLKREYQLRADQR
jgi:hypothetical protein